jgi:Tol biopolymer transport system component
MMRRIAIGVVAALAIVAFIQPLSSAQASFPGKNGKIAFTLYADGVHVQVYTADPRGQNMVQLTSSPGPGQAYEPSFSADGTKIAFTAAPFFSPREIRVMDADGRNQRTVISSTIGVNTPAFSPDGTRIAFSNISDQELYAVDSDGGNLTRLTFFGAGAVDPVYSPDGTKIAFQAFEVEGSEPGIYIMDANGQGLKRLADGSHPDFSPDGRKLIFSFEGEVKTMNPDGSDQRTIPITLFYSVGIPMFSPDGTKIAFGGGGGVRNLWEADLDGGDPVFLFRTVAFGGESWQPIPGPRREDFNNAAQFCKAEQAFWGDQFASRYGGGANAHGKCVSSSK